MIYDRQRGQVIRHEVFRDSQDAMAARFVAEREFKGHSDIEVVVLSARSPAALRRTHARYFEDFRELAESALGRVGT